MVQFSTKENKRCLLQAHRGVSTDCPENTMKAFREAVIQGYDLIELDPKCTADGTIVLLHDHTLYRTARRGGGIRPDPSIRIEDITLQEALQWEYGSWFKPEFSGEKLPELSEVLSFSTETGIPLKLDNVICRFSEPMTQLLFDEIEHSGALPNVGFTVFDVTYLRKVLNRFPEAFIHYDGAVDSEMLKTLSSLVPKERLVVWMRYPNRTTAWNTCPPVNTEMAEEIHHVAKLGVWILKEYHELSDAITKFHADII